MATAMIYFFFPPQSAGLRPALAPQRGLPTPAWLPRAEHSPGGTPSPSTSCLHPRGLRRMRGTGRHVPQGWVSPGSSQNDKKFHQTLLCPPSLPTGTGPAETGDSSLALNIFLQHFSI